MKLTDYTTMIEEFKKLVKGTNFIYENFSGGGYLNGDGVKIELLVFEVYHKTPCHKWQFHQWNIEYPESGIEKSEFYKLIKDEIKKTYINYDSIKELNNKNAVYAIRREDNADLDIFPTYEERVKNEEKIKDDLKRFYNKVEDLYVKELRKESEVSLFEL